MLFSTNILKQWIELPSDSNAKINYSLINKQLIAKLFEIEHGEIQRSYPALLVLGKVIEAHKHPNADTLFVCQVDCGSHGNFQICTGGENIASGQYVPTALPGCYLSSIDLTIGERKMRGEESNGMICSKGELGISEDEDKHRIRDMTHDVVCNDSMIGKPIAELFPWMENIIFEVESVAITNRPDLRGHLGLAIESRAILPQSKPMPIDELIQRAQRFDSQTIPHIQQQINNTTPVSFTIQSTKCSYYSLSSIDNALHTESAFPGRVSLLDLGHTPRGNRIDYSNYFMSLTGQPIHIFDKHMIIGNNIIIKEAIGGELFTDLTGKEHTLVAGDIIICDQEKILALAGIIGGLSSACNEHTTSICIEIAHFDPIQIRKTSTRLGLKTDAAVRFEKGIHPLWTAFCVAENYRILTENHKHYATGNIDTINQGGDIFAEKPGTLILDIHKASNYLYGSIHDEIIKKIPEILNKLGYIVKNVQKESTQLGTESIPDLASGGQIEVIPPIRRSDIQIIQDIYEDLARHIGLDEIPEIQTPIYQSRSTKTILDFQHQISHFLVQKHHLSQVECYPRYSEHRIHTLGLDTVSHLELLNPMDVATPFMAQNLLPGLLELAKKNYRFTVPIQVFEVGKIRKNEGSNEHASIHTEKILAGLYVQKKQKTWGDDSYVKVKSLVKDLCNHYHIQGEEVSTSQPYLHPNKQIQITKDNIIIGSIAQIHPIILEKLGFTEDIEISYFTLNIEDLFRLSHSSSFKEYHSNSDQFIQRDLSFELAIETSFDQIISIFTNNSIIEDYTIIDLYKPEGATKKSITIRFTIIGDANLTHDKVTEITNTIISEVEATGAVLKGVKA